MRKKIDDNARILIVGWFSLGYGERASYMADAFINMLYKMGYEIKRKKK